LISKALCKKRYSYIKGETSDSVSQSYKVEPIFVNILQRNGKLENISFSQKLQKKKSYNEI